MNYFYLLIAFVSIAAHSQEYSDSTQILQTQTSDVAIRGRVNLEPVLGAEITGSQGFSQGSNLSRLLTNSSSTTTLIRRELPLLWQTRIDQNGLLPQVNYTVYSLDGEIGKLSHSQDSNSKISVRVNPLRVTRKQTFSDQQLVQGGVSLWLDIKDVYLSGRYSGTVLVELTNF